MRHAGDDELVLLQFGEAEDGLAAAHVAECAECRARLAEIQRTLNLVDAYEAPRRGEEYGAEVWQRVRAELKLKAKPERAWWSWRMLVATAALATLVVAAFVAGRGYERRPKVEVAQAPAGERMLLYAMNEHLDRSQRVLLEISNSTAQDTQVREAAADLVVESRLYRQSLGARREPQLEAVLEDLEQFLTEASHASPGEWADLQKRLNERPLLFEVRSTRARLVAAQRGRLPVDSF